MHFLNPVAKTIYNHSSDDRMICIEGIAGARMVSRA